MKFHLLWYDAMLGTLLRRWCPDSSKAPMRVIEWCQGVLSVVAVVLLCCPYKDLGRDVSFRSCQSVLSWRPPGIHSGCTGLAAWMSYASCSMLLMLFCIYIFENDVVFLGTCRIGILFLARSSQNFVNEFFIFEISFQILISVGELQNLINFRICKTLTHVS